MRCLKPATLLQWGSIHRWKTTHSMPQGDASHRVRYLKCLRCRLRAKTEERPAVPWDEQDLLAMVKSLLPVGKPVYLRDHGITLCPCTDSIGCSKGRDT